MALTKPSMAVNIITSLATTSADRGLTDDQFKAKFDETPAAIKTYLNDTLTAELDTALGLKADKASPTFTGTVVLPSATSIGDVSSTELGYVNGVTLAIQTQLDAKRAIVHRVATTASSATPTPNCDTTDTYILTALAEAAEFGAPTGTPTSEQRLVLKIKDNGTARALTWNAIYIAGGEALPSTTVTSKFMRIGLIYDTTASKWNCVAVAQEE